MTRQPNPDGVPHAIFEGRRVATCPYRRRSPLIPATAGQVRREAERALQNYPDGATFAWAYKAEALRRLGRRQEAFDARLQIPAKLVIG
jgi:hypothetical protein